LDAHWVRDRDIDREIKDWVRDKDMSIYALSNVCFAPGQGLGNNC
jgi:hypothetical protein